MNLKNRVADMERRVVELEAMIERLKGAVSNEPPKQSWPWPLRNPYLDQLPYISPPYTGPLRVYCSVKP